jgi:hypothetical protein
MKTLQPTLTPYTVTERASKIYSGVLDIFDYNCSSDVVTPVDLAREQLKGIPIRGTLCVPGAGIGSYVLAALLEGFEPKNIYAIELDPAYHGLGSGIFSRFGVNYICEDFLTWNPKMKFDVVIGNPPYQDSNNAARNNKLWMKFIFLSLELLKDNGYLSFVTPRSFVGATKIPAQIRKLLSSDYSLLEVNHNADIYFKVGVKICSWLAVKQPYQESTLVTEGSHSWKINLKKDLPLVRDKFIPNAIAEKIYSIIEKDSTVKLKTVFVDSSLKEKTGGNYRVYYSGRNKFYYSDEKLETHGKWKIAFSFSATYKQWFVTRDDVIKTNRMILVETPEEGVEIGNTFMSPILAFYMDTWRKTAGYTPAIKNKDCLPDIRGMTDQQVKELFELTDEEYGYIIDNHVPYKSIQRVI